MKRKSITVDDRYQEHVDTIYETNGRLLSKALCIRLALRYCAEKRIQFFNGQPLPATMSIVGAENKKKAQSKEDWCVAFGGEVKNGVCHIHKYETTFSGHVDKNIRLQSIASFPNDREEFRKSMLENWETVEEAEAAYKAKPVY